MKYINLLEFINTYDIPELHRCDYNNKFIRVDDTGIPYTILEGGKNHKSRSLGLDYYYLREYVVTYYKNNNKYYKTFRTEWIRTTLKTLNYSTYETSSKFIFGLTRTDVDFNNHPLIIKYKMSKIL